MGAFVDTRSSASCTTGPALDEAPLVRRNVRDVSSPEYTRIALRAPA